jgi:hypothetical protein
VGGTLHRTDGRADPRGLPRRAAPLRPGRAPRPLAGWGTRPGRLGVAIVILTALAGCIITLLAGSEPGIVLGVLVAAGTLVAGTVVRSRSAYLIIPVPAPAYAMSAAVAGLVHDRAADASRTATALHGVQWLATGFAAMAASTAIAAAVTAVRWAARRRADGRRPRSGPADAPG